MPLADRSTYFIVTGLAVTALSGGAYLYHKSETSEPVQAQQPGTDRSRGVPVTLKLTDADGKAFDLATLSGRPVAIFFGFTQCPDVCPLTMQKLAVMREQIGAPFDDLRVVFVTLDPERDTPETLKSYFASLPVPVIGLTGSADEIDRAAKQFDVFYETVRYSKEDYTIDHTASLFLVDRQGRRAGDIGFDADESEFRQKLESVLK